MRQWAWLLALATPCAAAAQATPAEPPSSSAAVQDAAEAEDESTIVVTGETAKPAKDSEVYAQARELSRIDRYQLYEEALPRFEGSLCPAVFGLRDDYAAAISGRIRANAARLGIGLAEAGCAPNFVVAFVDDSGGFVAGLAHRRPAVFRLIAAPERAEILAEGAPVRVWNNIGLVWTGAGPPPPGWPRARPSVRGQLDRTSMPEAKVISSAAVLFERDAVIDMTLTQLADYATMRGLTHTRPADGDEPMETILALFARDGRAPGELTGFDIGYLRSLYRDAPNRSAASRFIAIRKRAGEAGD
jgi:hypothetical protein